MKKKRLEIDYHYDFELLGVISTSKGYKLAWEINKSLNIRLIRQSDLTLYSRNQKESIHNHFSYVTRTFSLRVFKNKTSEVESGVRFLVPEYPHMDYIIMLRGSDNTEEILELLRNIPSVELIAFIPLAALKSKENFIF